MNHAPAAGTALEYVRRENRGDADAALALRQDVLRTGDPGQVGSGHHLDVGQRETHLVRVGEDGLPRCAHRLPAAEHRPAGMHALDVVSMRPQLLHRGQVERLERAIEGGVRAGYCIEAHASGSDRGWLTVSKRMRAVRAVGGLF